MTETALIFDNDRFSMGFLQVVLSDLGLGVRAFKDAHDALELIRKEQPRVVFLDTMVPGAEGLSLCHAIKGDPALSAVKVVIVSGKVYWDDKARAGWAKADLYLHKPIDPEELYVELQEVVPGLRHPTIEPFAAGLPSPEATETRPVRVRPPPATDEEKRRERADRPWRLRFWGDGVESDCVSLVDRDRLLVFDAGRGLETLAHQPTAPGLKEVWLFISHFHKSHVAGLLHAKRWADAGLKVHIVGPSESENMLVRLVQRVLSGVPAEVHPAEAGDFELLDGLDVGLMYTMHPGPCFAVRVATPARSFVVAPDSELPRECPDHLESLAQFALGADALIHDARYSDEDYPPNKQKGHAHPRAALELALRADVRSLILCHTDAQYNAARRVKMLSKVLTYYEDGMKLENCYLACNGLQLDL